MSRRYHANVVNPRTWQEELAIIDDTMRAISGISDPEELVSAYWNGIGRLIPSGDYVSVSRRRVDPPCYLVTRSSRFSEHVNPWTQRDRLPQLSGGILGELAYANKPVIIEDLPSRLRPDDPGYFYLEGFRSLVAIPQYDAGEGLNVTAMLVPPGMEFDLAKLPMLHWQASLFGRGTQNLVLRNELGRALAALDRELQVVGEIQRSLLPREFPLIAGCEIAADYQTSARAGGDYYDFFPLTDGSWGIFIADVSGHGTPAAVLMAITHAIAHSKPGGHKPPAEMLAYVNERLTRSYTGAGTFVTAFYAVLEPRARRLTYSSAGHNPPRLVRGDGIKSLDDAGTLPMGIIEDQSFEEASLILERGDMLLFYTDGITEAMSPRNGSGSQDLFGVERLDAALLANRGATPQQCIESVRAAVEDFSLHAPATDDRTLIALLCS